MGSSGAVSEIVEFIEEEKTVNCLNKCISSKADQSDRRSLQQPLEHDLDQLIKVLDRRTCRTWPNSHHTASHFRHRSTQKKPTGFGTKNASGIGTSGTASLKQALRRLCISHAAEMAAIKRLSMPPGSCIASEAGKIEKMYASLVLQTEDTSLSTEEAKGNAVEISVVCEMDPGNSSEMVPEVSSEQISEPSTTNIIFRDCFAGPVQDVQRPIQTQDVPASETRDERSSVSSEVSEVLGVKENVNVKTYLTGSVKSSKDTINPSPIKPAFSKKRCMKNKKKQVQDGKSDALSKFREENITSQSPVKSKMNDLADSVCSAGSNSDKDVPAEIKFDESHKNKLNVPSSCNYDGENNATSCERLRRREKGECSQSSKSTADDHRSSTSISEDSQQTTSGRSGSRPHMSRDVRWVGIQNIQRKYGALDLKMFRLLKKLGSGDIGTVYLAELTGSDCLYALKVMDIEFLASRRKILRAQTEREILQMLDHPFLPTLYDHFTSDNLSCLVMEYCPGGDLHVLRQKQLFRCFSEPAARFYVAEVLLALEYLHMLGVIYRDLKPENILVREDGHIMLSDFDLSLRCKVNPTLLKSSSGKRDTAKTLYGPCPENSCINPPCLQPSCFAIQVPTSSTPGSSKPKSDLSGQIFPLPQLVVEPTDARSNSFVGTHEYLAPEIIKGDGHGSAVDWWTFGIFLYELLLGRTPFRGSCNEETLANVISESLKFPKTPVVSFHAQDLIRGLLVKEPQNRLGSATGAAEIKQHSFFEGLNWALIRCAAPPETPSRYEVENPLCFGRREGKCLDFRSNGDDLEFKLF